jgi:hypothetical protein
MTRFSRMDTRFWGPSGWKLLHLISFTYEYSATSATTLPAFLETIPYILPCKFCRASLTDYYRQYPYAIPSPSNGSMNPSLDLKKWMYKIHNCVNGKLRSQGLYSAANPPYSAVKKEYEAVARLPWNQQLALCWDFLFAVAYHHPTVTAKDAPLPDCPSNIKKCKDPCEKNKWNVLGYKERMRWFRRFWVFLPAVLPHDMAAHWEEVEKKNPPTLGCRRSSLAWLWRMRCGLDAQFRDPYTSVCKTMASYSSDCGTKGTVTCRRARGLSQKASRASGPYRRKTLKKTKA